MSELLDLSPSEVSRPEFAQAFGGNIVLRGSTPYSHCYCGHQFGFFSGQVGFVCFVVCLWTGVFASVYVRCLRVHVYASSVLQSACVSVFMCLMCVPVSVCVCVVVG
jgi:hypothetical protein